MKRTCYSLLLAAAILLPPFAFAQQREGVVSIPPGSIRVQQGEDGRAVVVTPDGSTMTVDTFRATNLAANGVDIEALRQQARQRTIEALKQSMGCTDDEWAVIVPRIELIQALQPVVGEAGSGSIGGSVASLQRVQPRISDVRARQADLRKAIQDGANSNDVRSILTSLREARQRAADELANIRKELIGLLTISQEAILYQRGILR